MMCQRIGRPPISTMGLGRVSVSSASRVPWPPARITTFIARPPSSRFDQQALAGWQGGDLNVLLRSKLVQSNLLRPVVSPAVVVQEHDCAHGELRPEEL